MNMYLELTFRYCFCIVKVGSSQTVKFSDNRIKTTSISFKTVHFIFYLLF